MHQDFLELLSAFNAHSVKYLIVGGYAVSLHAQPRATKDIDLLIQPEPDNANAIYAALASFGAPLVGMIPEDFARRGSFFRMGREPVAVDILTEISGVDFDSAWERRVDAVLDPVSGLNAHFISADDLIAAKLAAGRPQDIADAIAIQRQPKP
ncbi:MAG: nucleotidyl transferase AbiEii/AbiGii toxin family protein [Bryobacteraceae bacterium]